MRRHQFRLRSNEADVAHEVASQAVILINRKAVRENSSLANARVVPDGWDREKSTGLVNMAYDIAQFVKAEVPQWDYRRAVKSYLNSQLELGLADFEGKTFAAEQFILKNGKTISGQQMLQMLAKQSHGRECASVC